MGVGLGLGVGRGYGRGMTAATYDAHLASECLMNATNECKCVQIASKEIACMSCDCKYTL